MVTSRLTLLAVGGAVVASSSLVLWTYASRRDRDVPEWRTSLSTMPHVRSTPGPRFSAEYTSTRARMWNDVLHEERWDEAVAAELAMIARRASFDATPRDDAAEAEVESWLLSMDALHVIEARLNALAPIDPQARRVLLDVVLDSSRSMSRSRRHHACAALAGRGLFGDEVCRARLMELTRDPDTWVSDNARRHLAWAEGRGRARPEDRQ
ncbi:MAG: hypothetical protein IT439_01795 [Phycisphaerales bacterium]|nr:hypothetical protein [Phycisphaerales bacterium]